MAIEDYIMMAPSQPEHVFHYGPVAGMVPWHRRVLLYVRYDTLLSTGHCTPCVRSDRQRRICLTVSPRSCNSIRAYVLREFVQGQ